MRVFVTGASGGIGSAVVPELSSAGHRVVGLARSDASAAVIAGLGAVPLRGDLRDADALRAGAAQSDGVVHLAFGNDFGNIEANVEEETFALEVLAEALEGSGKAFVLASGTPVVPGRLATEADPAAMEGPLGGRASNAQAVLELAGRGVRSATVRLPRSVHTGAGRYGFASFLIAAARRTGVSGFVGDGVTCMPESTCAPACAATGGNRSSPPCCSSPACPWTPSRCAKRAPWTRCASRC